MQFDTETKNLLKSKGLKCICQLCDCGRTHNHPGCARNMSNVESNFAAASVKEGTEYQKNYRRADLQSPVKLLKPLPSSLNPHPPIMDFRTTNRMAFKRLKGGVRPKPCKLEEEYDGLSGAFKGESVYRVDYPIHKPLPIKMERPAPQKPQHDLQFDSTTMYQDAFYAKDTKKLKSFHELPSFTYSILYPDRAKPVARISVKNTIHSGEFAPRPEILAPKECAIKIGREGQHQMITTNGETFKGHLNYAKDQPIKAINEWKPRPTFDCKTQAQDDFQGFGGKIPVRRKPIMPPMETINLKVDDKLYFETTKGIEHKVTWDMSKVYRPPLQKQEEKYSTRKEKFDCVSVMHADFKEYSASHPTVIKPQFQVNLPTAKFCSDTSYKSQYPRYDNVEIKRYGDPYEQRYYIKPLSKFPDEPSTMHYDFKDHGKMKPRSPFQPEGKRHTNGGEFYDETSYSAEFKPKSLGPCRFSKLLADKDAVASFEKITESLKAKLFENIDKTKTNLAATF